MSRISILAFLLVTGCPAEGEDTGKGGGDDSGVDDSGDTAEDSGDSGDSGDTAEDSGDSGEDSGGDSGEDSGDGLPDVRDEMQRDATDCEDVSGTPVAGGAVYYWGDYVGNEADGWSGQEIAYLFANDTLEGYGQSDCIAIWNVDATSTSPGACAGCEVGLAVTLTYDTGASTCPEEMYGDNGETTYGVDQLSDARANWYYASSGNQMASGYWSEEELTFLTERQCQWF